VAEASGKTGNDKKVDVDAVMASEPTLLNTLNEKNNQSTTSAKGGE
jgi:cytochrome c biogenesis protein CcmG/thiol:disulfide interchange protein DsbE